jgi:hypothetical protein
MQVGGEEEEEDEWEIEEENEEWNWGLWFGRAVNSPPVAAKCGGFGMPGGRQSCSVPVWTTVLPPEPPPMPTQVEEYNPSNALITRPVL